MVKETQEWLELLKTRDPDALRTLYREHAPSLGRYLTGMVRDGGTAEDLVQDAFVRFLEHLETYRGEASPKSYLYRIATNLAINHLESARVRYETHPETLPEPRSGNSPPEDRFARSQEAEGLRAHLAALPPQQRSVVILKTWEECTFREIAAILDIAEGTAKAHYFFALKNLRKRLEADREP